MKTSKAEIKPSKFYVFVISRNPNYKNGKPTMQRVGNATTLEIARELLTKERRGIQDPVWRRILGPLNVNDGIQREYEIWEADWKRVD